MIFIKGNIIEGILVFIAIVLVGFLIWNQINYTNEKTILENEYDYNAVKLTYNENSITITSFVAVGSPTKRVETYYIKDGKVYKIIEEIYYKSINDAKRIYEDEMNQIDSLAYETSIKKNIVTHIFDEEDISSDNQEVSNFTTNEEFIKYAEEHICESYPESVRIY